MRTKYGTASPRVSEEAAFELGVVYSAVKDELVAFAAKEGSPYSFADVAARVAKLLQAEALREQLRHSEYLQEMRQNGAGHHRGRPPKSGYDELATTSEIFAGSSAGRALSKKARKAISKAQTKRWAKYHAKKEKHESSSGWSPERRAKYSKRLKAMYADPVLGKKLRRKMNKMNAASGKSRTPKESSRLMRNYWAAMTPEQRSAEMIRRRQVTARKAVAGAA